MRKELNIVIDTNVMISAALGKSATLNSIYNAFVNGLFTPVLSPALQAEILNTVKKPRLKKYFRAKEIRRLKELLKVDTVSVTPTQRISLCRDPKDNCILEAAVEAKADFIVTGDKDLLTLKYCRDIPIINPKEFIARIKK